MFCSKKYKIKAKISFSFQIHIQAGKIDFLDPEYQNGFFFQK